MAATCDEQAYLLNHTYSKIIQQHKAAIAKEECDLEKFMQKLQETVIHNLIKIRRSQSATASQRLGHSFW